MPDAGQQQPLARITVPSEADGQRLDVFLAEQFPQYSRVRLRRAITAGGVRVDDRGAKPSQRLKPGQQIAVAMPEREADGPVPEDIPLDILYEDEHLAAVNKPPGMVVHPAKGHWQGTLASALAHHFQRLSQVGGATRPGIVHRLDRDTSGVLVVAKTDEAHLGLASQFEQRTTEKHYAAIVVGVPDRDRDLIDEPIGPHPYHREKMAIRRQHPDARDAQSFYELIERFRRFSLLDVKLLTGRTHQIRLHLAHVGCPVLCDRLYGGRSVISAEELEGSSTAPPQPRWCLTRQALHSHRLQVVHPITKQPLQLVAPLPDDMRQVLELLRKGGQ